MTLLISAFVSPKADNLDLSLQFFSLSFALSSFKVVAKPKDLVHIVK